MPGSDGVLDGQERDEMSDPGIRTSSFSSPWKIIIIIIIRIIIIIIIIRIIIMAGMAVATS